MPMQVLISTQKKRHGFPCRKHTHIKRNIINTSLAIFIAFGLLFNPEKQKRCNHNYHDNGKQRKQAKWCG